MSNETSKDCNSAPRPAAAASTAGPLAPSTAPEKGAALPQGEMARLTDEVIAALKTVYDPEIPSDIFELGLIYKIDISDDRAVTIEMTLTTSQLSVRPGAAAQCGECGCQRAWRARGQGRDRMGPALGSEPDVG